MRPKVAVNLALGLCLASASCSSVPDTARAAENSIGGTSNLPFTNAQSGRSSRDVLVPHELRIPAGTPISVRLQDSISSASNRTGDEFAAILDDAIVVDSQTVAPRGAVVKGRVLAARCSGRMHVSGYLRLALVSLEIGGHPVSMHTSSVFVSGSSHKNRHLELMGEGAGTGALRRANASGKEAVAEGASGAATETTAADAMGNKDVWLAPERRLTFRLIQPLSTRD